MARQWRDAEELRQSAEMAQQVADKLKDVAARMDKHKLPAIFVHGHNPMNLFLPKTFEWATSLESELEIQLDAFLNGQELKAIKDYQRSHAARGTFLPPQPTPKKVTKKATKKKKPKGGKDD